MLKHGLYNTLSYFIKLSLSFLLVPVLIRIIGIEEYGLWTLVSTTLAIVMLAEGGLSNATLFFVSQSLGKDDDNHLSEVLSVVILAMLSLATIAALTILGIAPLIVKSLPQLTVEQNRVATFCLQLGSLLVWSRMIQGIPMGIEMACDSYKSMNLIGTLQSILTNIGMLVIAYSGGGILNLMQWQVSTTVCVLLVHIFTAWSLIKYRKLVFKFKKDNISYILKYSFSVWLTSLGSAIFYQADKLIVASLLGTKSLGIYAAITNTTAHINGFSAMAIQPVLPKLSGAIGNISTKQTAIQRQVIQAMQFNLAISLGMGGGLLIFDFLIMHILFGEQFRTEYVMYFRIAVVIYTLISLSCAGNYILLGYGMANLSMIAIISSGVIALAAIFVGASNSGLIGAIIGNSGFILILILNFWAMQKTKISFQELYVWALFPIVYTTGICAVNYLLIPGNQLEFKILIFVIEVLGIFTWWNKQQKISLNKLG